MIYPIALFDYCSTAVLHNVMYYSTEQVSVAYELLHSLLSTCGWPEAHNTYSSVVQLQFSPPQCACTHLLCVHCVCHICAQDSHTFHIPLSLISFLEENTVFNYVYLYNVHTCTCMFTSSYFTVAFEECQALGICSQQCQLHLSRRHHS